MMVRRMEFYRTVLLLVKAMPLYPHLRVASLRPVGTVGGGVCVLGWTFVGNWNVTTSSRCDGGVGIRICTGFATVCVCVCVCVCVSFPLEDDAFMNNCTGSDASLPKD